LDQVDSVLQRPKEAGDLENVPVIIVARYITETIRSESYKCDALFINAMDMDALAPRIPNIRLPPCGLGISTFLTGHGW